MPADLLAHLSGPVASLDELDGVVVMEKADDGVVLCAFARGDRDDADAMEKGIWHYTHAAIDAANEFVRIVESWTYRNPVPWDVNGDGSTVVRKGAWVAGFALSEPAWALYKSGELGPGDLVAAANTIPSKRKEVPIMNKADLQKAVDALQKRIDGLDPTGGAERSLATVGAAHGAVFGRMSHPFAPFEDRVAAAQAALTKAIQTDEVGWEVAVARQELDQERRRLTMMKMMAAETARERDPSIMARRLSGQGVPLISNRHQLPDDSGVAYQ